jgi:hypothetical protein
VRTLGDLTMRHLLIFEMVWRGGGWQLSRRGWCVRWGLLGLRMRRLGLWLRLRLKMRLWRRLCLRLKMWRYWLGLWLRMRWLSLRLRMLRRWLGLWLRMRWLGLWLRMRWLWLWLRMRLRGTWLLLLFLLARLFGLRNRKTPGGRNVLRRGGEPGR